MPASFGQDSTSSSLTTPGATFSADPVQGVARFAVPGPQGPQGDPGPPGSSGGTVQTFEFDDPSSEWVCVHSLGREPFIAAYDLDGNLRPFIAVANPDPDTTVLTPIPPLAGKVLIT